MMMMMMIWKRDEHLKTYFAVSKKTFYFVTFE